MRILSFVVAASLSLAIAISLPSGYYTYLRIVVPFAAVLLIFNDGGKNLNFWTVAFLIAAVLFNPILPVSFHGKAKLIFGITGAIFLIKGLMLKK